ncbi:MAG: CsgG/HfaB family protein [Candidatus Neomarinimicrobiota bacterium]
MKVLISSILFSGFVSFLSGQETVSSGTPPPDSLTTIAVLPLEGKGISTHESEILTERLRSTLVQDGRYQVVERSQMQEIMREQGFQQTGCISQECLVQAGLILGAMKMVSGTVGRLGQSFAVDVRLFDVETARIVRAVTRDHKGTIDRLLPVITDVGRELAGEGPVTASRSMNEESEDVSHQLEAAFDKVTTSISRTFTSDHGEIEEITTAWGMSWSPFQFSVLYPLQLVPARVDIYGLRITLLYGKNENLFGFDNGFINEINDTVIGYQTGVYNKSGKVYGAQWGLLNTCERLYGVQIGVINRSDHLRGVQIGVLNFNPVSGGIPFMPFINIGF